MTADEPMGILSTLSLGSSTLFRASPLETVEAAAAGGFDAVGVRVAGRAPGDGSPSVVGDASAIRELRQRSDDAGVPITHVTAFWANPQVPIASFLPVIETAAALGAGTIVVNCGYAEEAPFVAFMASYGESAARCRLRLALEFMPYSGAKTLAQAQRMIERAERDNVGLMVDPLHLARSGGTPADVRSVEPGRIYMLQLCDAPLEKQPDVELRVEALSARLYPGEGELPLHELLDAVTPGVQLDVEAPSAKHASLAPADQARQAAAACRRFLARHAARRPS
jgi:sugar phosphate isomerase/epimerase